MIQIENAPQPFYQYDRGILYNCDALTLLPAIPDESVDMIITDPPYFISQEVVIHRAANYKYKGGGDISLHFGEWDVQWKSEREYMDWCFVWLKECVRILKPEKHLVFFYDKKKVTPVWEFLESLGIKGRGPLYWIKSNPVPRARKVDFMKAVEMALWFTKKKVTKRNFNWQLGMAKDYVVAPIPSGPNRWHPTQKATLPIKQWVNYLSKPDDIILDPFFGSGTTGIVAHLLGRRWIGVEINQDYCRKAIKTMLLVISQSALL